MKLEKEAKEEELSKHQQHVCERMAKMDTYLKQYQLRKDKLLEEEKRRVGLRNSIILVSHASFWYTILF